MAIAWLYDYTTPTEIITTPPSASLSYLNKFLVIIQDGADQQNITTLALPTEEAGLTFLNGALAGGNSTVDYIKRVNGDITSLLPLIQGNYFTLIFVDSGGLGGFEPVTTGFLGNIIRKTTDDTLTQVSAYTGYVNDTDGYTSVKTVAMGLSGSIITNGVYRASVDDTVLTKVTNKTEANKWYDKKAITWGKDETLGTYLVSSFIGGFGFAKNYIIEGIRVKMQEVNFNYLLTKQPPFTDSTARILEVLFSSFVTANYLNTGRITGFNVAVSKSTTNGEYVTNYDVTVPYPVWKNNFKFTV